MKKDIGNRSFVEMYLITKEDKNLLDKCVLHLNQKDVEKNEPESSSILLSQSQTLNTTSEEDKTDNSEGPPSNEKPDIHNNKEEPKNETLRLTKNNDKENSKDKKEDKAPEIARKDAKIRKKKTSTKTKKVKKAIPFQLFSTPYSPIKTRNRKLKKTKKKVAKMTKNIFLGHYLIKRRSQ